MNGFDSVYFNTTSSPDHVSHTGVSAMEQSEQ